MLCMHMTLVVPTAIAFLQTISPVCWHAIRTVASWMRSFDPTCSQQCAHVEGRTAYVGFKVDFFLT